MMTLTTMLAQATDTSPTDSNAAVAVQSVLDFVLKGGFMMIPIGLCSLVAMAIVIERMVSLRRSKVIPPSFFPGLKKLLKNRSSNGAEAIAYCKKDGSPVANVFAAGMKKLNAPLEILEKHIQDAGQREVLKLRKFLRALSVIASITPLMGLLGTIFGMIKAFQTVAISADALGKTELLAAGIYQAMITTAAGLVVAIPVLIAFHWVASKIDRLVMEIDLMTVEVIESFAEGDYESADASESADETVSSKMSKKNKKSKKIPGRDTESRHESPSVHATTS